MKKIFAISVLSVMAVVATTDAWATENPPNYNLATVNYVNDAVLETKGLVIKSDKQTSVAGGWNPSGYAGSDYVAPTIKYMENSIAEAVAGVDTSGLVERAQVITSDGVDMDGNDISSELTLDEIVPTVANVEAKFVPKENVAPMEAAAILQQTAVDVQSGATISPDATEEINSVVPSVGVVAGSFVPNVAVDYYNGATWVNSTTMQEPGAYLLMVIVDENGNKSYRWVATQIDSSTTSAGNVAE